MDGQEHSLTARKTMLSSTEDWLHELTLVLCQLVAKPGLPRLDIHWLLELCQDTQRCSGDLREASMKQLAVDLAAFSAEFPGILSEELVRGMDPGRAK